MKAEIGVKEVMYLILVLVALIIVILILTNVNTLKDAFLNMISFG